MAVMKDDEVDRLERAGKAASGATRQEVMESMYGRIDPKPKGMILLSVTKEMVRTDPCGDHMFLQNLPIL